ARRAVDVEAVLAALEQLLVDDERLAAQVRRQRRRVWIIRREAIDPVTAGLRREAEIERGVLLEPTAGDRARNLAAVRAAIRKQVVRGVRLELRLEIHVREDVYVRLARVRVARLRGDRERDQRERRRS